MIIDYSIILQSSILAITTTLVLYYILSKTKPSFLMKDNIFQNKQAIISSIIVSIIFTVFVTIVSIEVDKQIARKKK